MIVLPLPTPTPSIEAFALVESEWGFEIPLMACVRGVAPPSLVIEASRRLAEAASSNGADGAQGQ